MASALNDELFGEGESSSVGESEVPGFILEEILGEGASGIVWKALETEPPHREVALKILKSGAPDDESAIRFEAEMAALAKMDHPGIARVFRSGTTVDDRPFFAMERIEGPPINCYEQDLQTRLKVFQQVCDAIGHAHRRGIIHRDLKPSNVLIGIEDELTQAKVIDFGIAKATDSLLTEKTLLTRAHQFLGTPAYMSPEQAEMRVEAVDNRSDIYSLGVILYELLTGKTPIAFESLKDLPYDEILRRIRTQEPQRPSVHESSIDRDLDCIVLKALSRDPAGRYETADAFSRDVQRFLEGRAIVARPPTTIYRVRKYVNRNRGKVLSACAILLAMIAGTITSTVMYVRAESHRKQAELNEKKGQRIFSQADFSQATTMLESDRPALAVAHLARAVRTYPDNDAASRKLLFTLASEPWAQPVGAIPHRGTFTFIGGKNCLASVSNFPADRHHAKHYVHLHDLTTKGEKARFQIKAPGNCLALSPDEKTLAAGGWFGDIWLWDLETGRQIRHIKRQGKGVSQLEFSPDGKLLFASYWHTNAMSVWSCDSGELKQRVSLGEANGRGYLGVSSDGREFVFGVGELCRVFQTSSGKILTPLLKHEGEVTGVAHLDAGQVLTWARDGHAKVWDSSTGELAFELAHESAISSGAVSPDKKRFFSGTSPPRDGMPGFSRLWDLKSGTLIRAPIRHPAAVKQVCFSGDGTRAAVANKITGLGQGAVRVLDAKTGEFVTHPIYHPRGGTYVALNENGSHLVVGSRHHESMVWEIADKVMKPLVLKERYPIWRVVFESGGKHVMTLGYDGRARRWNAHSGQALSLVSRKGSLAVSAHMGSRDPLNHGISHLRYSHSHEWKKRRQKHYPASEYVKPSMNCFAVSQDGEILVSGGLDGRVRVYSVARKKLLKTLAHGESPITEVALDQKSQLLVSGAKDGSVRLWNFQTGKLMAQEQMQHGAITALAIRSSGEVIAIGSQDDRAFLWWQGKSPKLSEGLRGHGRVNHFSFSPDGKTLAAAGESNAVLLWDVATAKSKGPPLKHIDVSTYGLFVLWSADSRFLVSTGSHDNTARYWEVATGEMLTKPMEHPAGASAVALSPDDRALLFADGARSVRIWDLASGESLTPLLQLDNRSLGCAFDKSGARFACSTLGGSVYIWDLPLAKDPLPNWFLDYAEALAGFRFNGQGVLEAVAATELEKKRVIVLEELEHLKTGNSRHWMKWLASDPAKRPASPQQYEHLGKTLQRWGSELLGIEKK